MMMSVEYGALGNIFPYPDVVCKYIIMRELKNVLLVFAFADKIKLPYSACVPEHNEVLENMLLIKY